MPSKSSWWSDNWKSIAWLIFFMGVAWTQLDYKVDRVEAREIAIGEIKDRCYSKVDGEILKNDLSHIKKQLDRIEGLVRNN
jgi:hypothetical protein